MSRVLCGPISLELIEGMHEWNEAYRPLRGERAHLLAMWSEKWCHKERLHLSKDSEFFAVTLLSAANR